MADSEISTSLSRSTRRDVLAAVVLTASGQVFGQPSISETSAASDDAAVIAWKAWREVHRRTVSLCRKQQRLETALVRTIGFPHVVLDATELPSPTRIGSVAEFDEIAARLPSLNRLRLGVMAHLLAHQARWDSADRAVGYSNALHEEELSVEEEMQLAVHLLASEATSLPGIVAKLDALMALGGTSEGCREFPWPQLRQIAKELAQVGS